MKQMCMALLSALVLASCAGPDFARNDRPGSPLIGNWGGAHVTLTLTDSGGRIEYDCASGTLDAAIRPDADGAFSVNGHHVSEHGGPVRVGEVPDTSPAVYVGTAAGGRMTLRIRTGQTTLGPFVLTRDAPAQLLKCL
ncbi:MAG TPA: hypothetical protein VHF02_02315 [Luteimonas sp.]|nr:hypothetical protein [Luteimonas sp.]